jgi:predicted secreted protein
MEKRKQAATVRNLQKPLYLIPGTPIPEQFPCPEIRLFGAPRPPCAREKIKNNAIPAALLCDYLLKVYRIFCHFSIGKHCFQKDWMDD